MLKHKRSTGAANNINDGSLLFKCPRKSRQRDREPARNNRSEFSRHHFYFTPPVLFFTLARHLKTSPTSSAQVLSVSADQTLGSGRAMQGVFFYKRKVKVFACIKKTERGKSLKVNSVINKQIR